MKKILLILFMATFALTSCTRDDRSCQGKDGEKVVQMSFFTPTTYALGDDTEAEKKINELDLLVFKNNQFQYRRYGYALSDGSFRSTLKAENGITIYFVANARALLDANESVMSVGADWETVIRSALVMSNPQGLIAPTGGLPMWGQISNVNIEDVSINYLGTITLLRSVASADVIFMVDKDTFELKNASLYFAADKGFLAPMATDYDPVSGYATGVTPPSTMATNVKLTSSVVSDNSMMNQFYMYENDYQDGTVTTRRATRLVVGGEYLKSGKTTYYPLDFRDLADDYYRIMRNNKYIVIVTKVHGSGYDTDDEASEAHDSGLEADVLPWDKNTDPDIEIDGSYYLSRSKSYATLFRATGSEDSISLWTNIGADKFTLSFKETKNGTTQSITNGIENDRFRVQMSIGSSGKPEKLIVTALDNYNTSDLSSNEQTLVLKAHRIQFEISITQINSTPSDWNDGGDIGDPGGNDLGEA